MFFVTVTGNFERSQQYYNFETQWTYHKEGSFASNYLIYLFIYLFIYLKTLFPYKNLPQRVNLVYQLPKCSNSLFVSLGILAIWVCFFPMSILNKYNFHIKFMPDLWKNSVIACWWGQLQDETATAFTKLSWSHSDSGLADKREQKRRIAFFIHSLFIFRERYSTKCKWICKTVNFR